MRDIKLINYPNKRLIYAISVYKVTIILSTMCRQTSLYCKSNKLIIFTAEYLSHNLFMTEINSLQVEKRSYWLLWNIW